MQSGRNVKAQISGVNETTNGNDTIARVVAQLNKEENQKSETGNESYQNEEWLREKRAE